MNPHLWQVASSHGWGFSWLSKAAPGPTAEPRLVDRGLGQGGKSILPPSSAPITFRECRLGKFSMWYKNRCSAPPDAFARPLDRRGHTLPSSIQASGQLLLGQGSYKGHPNCS